MSSHPIGTLLLPLPVHPRMLASGEVSKRVNLIVLAYHYVPNEYDWYELLAGEEKVAWKALYVHMWWKAA